MRNPVECAVCKNAIFAAFGISRSTCTFALSYPQSLANFRFSNFFERVSVASKGKVSANDISFDRISCKPTLHASTEIAMHCAIASCSRGLLENTFHLWIMYELRRFVIIIVATQEKI